MRGNTELAQYLLPRQLDIPPAICHYLCMTEAHILARIARMARGAAGGGGLVTGMGDDAAVLRAASGRDWVVSTDNFNEGTHFLPRLHPPAVAGYKALARALSDLAAMGARPRFFFLAITLPRSRTGAWLDSFLRGLRREARQYGVTLAGGDTSRSAAGAGVAINITVAGEVARGRAVLRSGARPGDALFVSGTLGAAQQGLEVLVAGLHRGKKWQPLLRRHLRPEPRLALGQWLAGHGLASSMMDTSDGLSTDLARLCAASSVRARLDPGAPDWPGVRVPAALAARVPRLRDALRLALHGGEDYELLFTVPRRFVRRIPRRFRAVSLTKIGGILPGRHVEMRDASGRIRPLRPAGWDPFL